MTAKPKRVYWDACVWIALINQEKSITIRGGKVENRFAMCSVVLELAKTGKIEIATSAFTLAEVCKSPEIIYSPIERLSSFFERSFILTINVDLAIGRNAAELQTSGLTGLKPPDAVHLASARRASVAEFHTFDQKLIDFDGHLQGLQGNPIKICRPTMSAPMGPLFEASD